MKIEIWSDIVCPFCYIGKRKFENALNKFEHKESVDIVWRSFQLDPDMEPTHGQSIHDYLAERKGVSPEKGKEMNDYMGGVAKEVGLEYHFDKAIITNTLNAHRLLHLANKYGVQNSAKEKLFAAYFTKGMDIGNVGTLIEIGESLNIPSEETRSMLQSDLYIDEVYQDQIQAQQIRVQGVPFFVFNNKYAISGAQPTQVFEQALQQIWEEESPVIDDLAGDFCNKDEVC